MIHDTKFFKYCLSTTIHLQVISVQLLLLGAPLLLVGEASPVGLLLRQAALLGEIAALALPRLLFLAVANLTKYSLIICFLNTGSVGYSDTLATGTKCHSIQLSL